MCTFILSNSSSLDSKWNSHAINVHVWKSTNLKFHTRIPTYICLPLWKDKYQSPMIQLKPYSEYLASLWTYKRGIFWERQLTVALYLCIPPLPVLQFESCMVITFLSIMLLYTLYLLQSVQLLDFKQIRQHVC